MKAFRKEVNMKVEVVKPLSSKKENVYVAIAFAVILLIAYTVFNLNRGNIDAKILGQNEISLYKDMNNIESSTYSELVNALMEIDMMKEDGRVPDVETLADEKVEPFYRDETWENKGSIEWYNFVDHGVVYILGISGNLEKSGNFLVALDGEDINKSNIYYTKDHLDQLFEQNNYHAIMALFKKIVPYTGNDENAKFRGGENV